MSNHEQQSDNTEKKAHKKKLKEAELRQALADAEAAELELERKRIDLASAQDTRAIAVANPDLTGNFSFNAVVGEASVENLRARLLSFARRNPGHAISVSFTTPGGSVFDGIHLYDTLRTLSAEGHHITTVASGFSASMGAILLQAGDHRIIGSESMLMIHEVSSVAVGKAGEIKREAEFLDKVTRQFAAIMARRSTLTENYVFDKIQNNDWWIWPHEALELGFVDEVRPL
jgi:ATP-dependent Clp protease protease subunit